MMKSAERILIPVVLFGVILKFLHVPGGHIIMVVGLSALAILYFYSGDKRFAEKESTVSIPFLDGLVKHGLPIALIGIMFKLQHWPGADPLLLAGIITCLAAAAYAMWIMQKHPVESEYNRSGTNPQLTPGQQEAQSALNKSKYDYAKNILIRAAVTGAIALSLCLAPARVMISLEHWDNAENSMLMTKVVKNAANTEYEQELENYRAKKFNYELNNYSNNTLR